MVTKWLLLIPVKVKHLLLIVIIVFAIAILYRFKMKPDESNITAPENDTKEVLKIEGKKYFALKLILFSAITEMVPNLIWAPYIFGPSLILALINLGYILALINFVPA